MSFNPASYKPVAAILRPTAAPAAPAVDSSVAEKVKALEQAAAQFARRPRQDDFTIRSQAAALDMAAKLERFGSFVSDAQASYADKLIAWAKPREAAPVQRDFTQAPAAPVAAPEPKAYPMALPKLFALMQRLAKLRFDGLTIARKNGDSLCWVKVAEREGVVGKIENGQLVLFTGRLGNPGDALKAKLAAIEQDPEAAAVLYGKASGNCSICGRDLTDPESIERGIGPICAGKYFS